MIEKVVVQNFRCLRDVRMRLDPLTVLVGANGSGKSSMLAAILGRFTSPDHWRKDRNLAPRVDLLSAGRALTTSTYTATGWVQTGKPPATQLLQLDLQQLRNANVLKEARAISTNGDGLTNVFATLSRPQQEALAKEFCRLVPMYADVAARPQNEGTHRLVFQDRWDPTVWYEPREVSDGSMLMFAFLALQHQNPSPQLIGIEEPERGLHPFLLNELVTMLRRLTRGELGGKKVQVVLATHSADLLEFVDPREVRFLSRSVDTGDVVVEEAPVETPEWPKVVREYQGSLGKLWLSGGLGGVPGT